jgi:hypothetical protein
MAEGESGGGAMYEPEVVLAMHGFGTWDEAVDWLLADATPQETEMFLQMVRMALP